MNYSRTDEGATTTLRVRGELDALSAPALRPVLDDLVESDRRDITVELSGLCLVDSSGVGALVSLYKRIRAKGGEVRFAGVNAQPLVIFQLLRLDAVFGLATDSPQLEESPEVETEQVVSTPSPVRVES
jgi:anti-sigma B factor antagonist